MAIGSLALGATTTAAASADDKSQVEDGWNLRECGDSQAACGVFGYTVGNQSDETWCWKDGGGLRWFKITAWINANGAEQWKTGWMNAGAIPVQAEVPGCSTWDL